MSTNDYRSQYDWADLRVHPGVKYPSAWVGVTAVPIAIGMVDSFTPRKTTPHDIIDSLNDHNQGMSTKAARYTVDVTVKPFGSGFEILQACQNGDRYFDVVLQPLADYAGAPSQVTGLNPRDSAGEPTSNWGPGSEVFIGCKVNDSSERFSIGTVPTVTFSCSALRFKYGSTNKEFGNGYQNRLTTDDALGLPTAPSP
jgi:hypothetical protein